MWGFWWFLTEKAAANWFTKAHLLGLGIGELFMCFLWFLTKEVAAVNSFAAP